MRVFVAGHKGLVGASLLRNIPSEFSVITADRDSLDLTSELEVYNFLAKNQINAVILAAAKVGGIGANSSNQRIFLVENLKIQNAVIEAALKFEVKNLVFLGSSCIYPKDAPQPISEGHLLQGPLEKTNEGYALAKIAGVKHCTAIFEEMGFNYFSLMPTNLYGPNDNFDLEMSHVPAALMRKFHEAKLNNSSEVVVWGTGSPRREFMHVDDMARACWYLLQQNVGGELINVGTGQDLKISEFAKLISSIVGFEGEIAYDTTKPDGTIRKLLDVSKIQNYGWKYEIELEDGLRQTYEWFVNALKKGEVRGY